MSKDVMLKAGDRVLVGTTVLTVDTGFAESLQPGDTVLGVAGSGQLRRIPRDVSAKVDESLSAAQSAFPVMASVDQSIVTRFFDVAAARLADDEVFAVVRTANVSDVELAAARGRSTTRLQLTDAMRASMVEALLMWRDTVPGGGEGETVRHVGWTVTERRAPLGVIGFVFEGRPNVFADATGVLRGGNTVVFRIGSDALGTARALMDAVIRPSLSEVGLPAGAVNLVDSPDHAAGWAMFADSRLSLAVARGSGEAVSELGSIARQAGVPVSLHGTGGAWMIVGESTDTDRLASVVRNSLDRKVCNTLNVVCLPRSRATELGAVVSHAADLAASARGGRARIHAVGDAYGVCGDSSAIDVVRADGTHSEPRVTRSSEDVLGREFEWEGTPEFAVVLHDSLQEAVDMFNRHSPQFVVSCVSEDEADHTEVWDGCNAPFVGDGFTRWVDGQFALLRPELGLSNWQGGRLFARSGILSGDSAYSVRLRVRQTDIDLHR